MRPIYSLIIGLAAAGCAGTPPASGTIEDAKKLGYIRPGGPPAPSTTTRIIDKPREAIWNAAVRELSKQAFAISNVDKASGVINIRFSGELNKYIDCGRVTSHVKDAKGERAYDFAASAPKQAYEILDVNGRLFSVDRQISLQGRGMLIIEEVTPTQTRVTVNTRYVVQRQITVTNASGVAAPTLNDTASFNTGTKGRFAGPGAAPAECVATGALEQEILSPIR